MLFVSCWFKRESISQLEKAFVWPGGTSAKIHDVDPIFINQPTSSLIGGAFACVNSGDSNHFWRGQKPPPINRLGLMNMRLTLFVCPLLVLKGIDFITGNKVGRFPMRNPGETRDKLVVNP